MDELKRFFKSINYEIENEDLNDVKVTKVIVRKKDQSFEVFLNAFHTLNLATLIKLNSCAKNGINGKQKVKIKYSYDVITADDILKAFKYFLKDLISSRPSLSCLEDNDVFVNDKIITLEVNSKVEENLIIDEKSKLLKLLKTYGYNDLELVTKIVEKREILAKEEVKIKVELPKENPVIYGKEIKIDSVVPIVNITDEVKNIVVEVYVFGLEYVTREKIHLINLKVSDGTDSIMAKIKFFNRDMPNSEAVFKKIKEKNWYKIEGYVEFDPYAKDLVLSIRSMENIPSKFVKKKDEAPNKRAELHTHTMMSQMDGVADEIALVKQAINFGHRGIAITDHNGCQAFPHVYNTVRDFNKGIEKEEDKFKAIYGTELTMVEDQVNITFNPKDLNLADAIYVVFDTETTGFNAGIGDSMIEIGAVKMQYGEIIERFDELINPGCEISDTITEVTNIENYMLKDKDNEENVTKRFKDFIKDYPLVAHNAKFDKSFIDSAYYKYNLGELTNPIIDTLELSRALNPESSKHSLSALVKKYAIPFDEEHHHRADYDAEGTGYIFNKMLKEISVREITNLNELNSLVKEEDSYKAGNTYHLSLLALNKTGLKNLFKIISYANTNYLYKMPRIPRHVINELREGILISSSCYRSEVWNASLTIKNDEELAKIIGFYDLVEVQPPSVYEHLVWSHDVSSMEQLLNNIKRIINTTEKLGKKIVATGDVHQVNKEDTIYREIIVNQKVPGGGLHPLSRVLRQYHKIPSQYLMTTNEMLDEFKFLDKELAEKIVITNPNEILDMADQIEVIIDTGGIPFSPRIENSVETVKELVYGRAHNLYGEKLPELIDSRIEQELSGIIKGGFDVIYLIAQKLVKKSNDDGYIVGSRGSVGSSLVANFMGISEVNPLPAHYRCPNCKHSIFELDGENLGGKYPSGFDLPDYNCPNCGILMKKDGQDMPFATFLGFDADKVPDIDLNFSGEYQWKAHEYTKVLFGIDNVYRAGTVGTVADKTAYGYVQGYFEDQGITNKRSMEIERLSIGCTGVKRTTGQHPGGIVVVPGYMDIFDFTPFQYPAEDNTSLWRTTHFDYHAIDQDLLKLDILGHDDPTVLRMLQDYSGFNLTEIPLDDLDTMSIFSSPEILGVTKEDIMCETGTLGVPEFGTKFVIQMLQDTRPKTFAELIKISGLSHGTDVWLGNAQELIQNKVVPFKEVIGCRDDIMVYLMYHGMEPKKSFKIMEFVRKGKASKDPEGWKVFEEEMRTAGIEDWFINSCKKIKYMFPKAHAAAYVTSAFKIAWFKVHYPLWYYSAYFSIRVSDFDVEAMIKGKEAIRNKIIELQNKGNTATNKEISIIDTLRVALEMTARGLKFKPINLVKSHARNFVLGEDEKSLYIPFAALDGMGESVAQNIIVEKEKGPFISIEDFQVRCKVNGTQIEKLKTLRVFEGLPESSQLSLF